jgi:hypothetical protein
MKIFEAASSNVVLTITDMGFVCLPSDMGVEGRIIKHLERIASSFSKRKIIQGREKKIE